MQVLKFTASWCGPCKMMAPMIEEFKQENEDVQIIDIDTDSGDSRQNRYEVMSVPTFIIVDELGNKIDSASGYMTRDMFEGFINKNR